MPAKHFPLVLASLGVMAAVWPATAGTVPIVVATELTSFSLTGAGLLPLGRATGAPQGSDVLGYRYVNSSISISESATLASLGQALIFRGFCTGDICVDDADVQQGDSLFVQSFFDVFFDITLTDIDPANNYWGPTGMLPDGTPIGPVPNGIAAHVQFNGPCIADLTKVNYGCLPPTGNAYIGHFKVVLNLGFDINGNGFNDTVMFTLATHNVGDVTSTFLSGNQAVDTFNSTLDLNGQVLDEQDDPPFSFRLTGPTTATQGIVVGAAVPEPSTSVLVGFGLLAAGWARRRLQR